MVKCKSNFRKKASLNHTSRFSQESQKYAMDKFKMNHYKRQCSKLPVTLLTNSQTAQRTQDITTTIMKKSNDEVETFC